jgi:hypothetical protein
LEDRSVAHLRTAYRSGLPGGRSWRLRCRPNAHILENIDGGSLADLGALAEPIRIKDGWFTPPNRLGHRILFGRTVLAAHTIES